MILRIFLYQCSSKLSLRKSFFEDWDKLKPKFRAAHRFAADKGWKFKIISETRLYDQYWENINFLKKFRRSHVGAVDQQLTRYPTRVRSINN